MQPASRWMMCGFEHAFTAENVFTKGVQAAKSDTDAVQKPDFDADVKLEQKADGWYLTLTEAQSVV